MTSDSKTTSRKFTKKELLITGLSLILAIIFLSIAFSGVNVSDVFSSMMDVSLYWLFLMILFQMLSHYFRALRWKVVIGEIKNDVSVNVLMGSLLIGYALNGIIPRLGELSRAVIVGKMSKVSRTATFGTIVIERVIDLFFFAGSIILAAVLYEGDIYLDFPWLKTSVYLGGVAFLIAVVAFIFSIRYEQIFVRHLRTVVSLVSAKLAERAVEVFEKVNTGLGSLSGVVNYLIMIAYSVLIMLFYALTAYAGFQALGIGTELTVTDAFVVMAISSIGVMIPTPGGIGSYHTLAKSVLVSLYALTAEQGIVYATFVHGVTYILHIVVAVGYFFYFKFSNSQITGDTLLNSENE